MLAVLQSLLPSVLLCDDQFAGEDAVNVLRTMSDEDPRAL